jgi:hypothetical protein
VLDHLEQRNQIERGARPKFLDHVLDAGSRDPVSETEGGLTGLDTLFVEIDAVRIEPQLNRIINERSRPAADIQDSGTRT